MSGVRLRGRARPLVPGSDKPLSCPRCGLPECWRAPTCCGSLSGTAVGSALSIELQPARRRGRQVAPRLAMTLLTPAAFEARQLVLTEVGQAPLDSLTVDPCLVSSGAHRRASPSASHAFSYSAYSSWLVASLLQRLHTNPLQPPMPQLLVQGVRTGGHHLITDVRPRMPPCRFAGKNSQHVPEGLRGFIPDGDAL